MAHVALKPLLGRSGPRTEGYVVNHGDRWTGCVVPLPFMAVKKWLLYKCGWSDHHVSVRPWSPSSKCATVQSRYIGDGHHTFNRNPYNRYINPYYWVDDHPLLDGNNGSLDPGTSMDCFRDRRLGSPPSFDSTSASGLKIFIRNPFRSKASETAIF